MVSKDITFLPITSRGLGVRSHSALNKACMAKWGGSSSPGNLPQECVRAKYAHKYTIIEFVRARTYPRVLERVRIYYRLLVASGQLLLLLGKGDNILFGQILRWPLNPFRSLFKPFFLTHLPCRVLIALKMDIEEVRKKSLFNLPKSIPYMKTSIILPSQADSKWKILPVQTLLFKMYIASPKQPLVTLTLMIISVGYGNVLCLAI